MIRIVPAIDLIDGKCVRLTQGDYAQKKVYNEDPLEVAKMFEDHGIKHLHLVDLDGARQKHVINHKVLERIASNTSLSIDFGGGIKTDEDLKLVFESGAKQATIGSVAITNPDLFESWIKTYGAEKMILGADAKNGKIAVSGWMDVTDVDIFDFFAEYQKKQVKYVLCTDISRDGMLQGTAIDLYVQLANRFPDLNIIASGGVAKADEIDVLNEKNIFAVIIGKAIYEGTITLKELEKFC
ncbi:MAG: 1-(5-phosphoribosyl)-5-[(5-phosphoribosylamino)methylideneamino]imidazole-4-carboxamide isomerase [Bacteroidota bacterium]|nr:1-(5-phosphoribosyl)-5-[(5-phosphoribosylamino)methylideneamino]imidazole-4-carboxamide isomerase [Bacteroidota bacterium]